MISFYSSEENCRRNVIFTYLMGKEVPAKFCLFFFFFLIQLCFIMEKTLSVWLICPLCSFIYREDLLFKHSLKCREGCRSQIQRAWAASDSSVQTVVKFWMGVCSKGEHSECVMSNLDSLIFVATLFWETFPLLAGNAFPHFNAYSICSIKILLCSYKHDL